MADASTLLRVLSATAITSTVAIFLCGLQICARIRSRGSTEGTSAAPFLLSLINAVFWLQYGLLKKDQVVVAVNAIGLVLAVCYTAYYYVNTRVKRRLHLLLSVEVLAAIGMYFYVHHEPIDPEAVNHLGLACMLLNIANVAAPLFALGHVIRTRNTESLPLPLCVGNFVVTAQWLLYGILVDDFYITFPNAAAVVISACQLSLFVIFPRRPEPGGSSHYLLV